MSAFDEREIVRWDDVELMARTAIAAERRGDGVVAAGAVLLPGVLDRVIEIEAEEEHRKPSAGETEDGIREMALIDRYYAREDLSEAGLPV